MSGLHTTGYSLHGEKANNPGFYWPHPNTKWDHRTDQYQSVHLLAPKKYRFVYDQDKTVVFIQNKKAAYVKINNKDNISHKQRILLAAAYTVN